MGIFDLNISGNHSLIWRQNELFSIEMLQNSITYIVNTIWVITSVRPETQFRRPSWISQNAQRCRAGTWWNLKKQYLPFQKIPKHLLYTSMPRSFWYLPDYYYLLSLLKLSDFNFSFKGLLYYCLLLFIISICFWNTHLKHYITFHYLLVITSSGNYILCTDTIHCKNILCMLYTL